MGDNADDFDDDPTQTTDSDNDGYGDNLSGNNGDAFLQRRLRGLTAMAMV